MRVFKGKDEVKLDALVNFLQSTSSGHICSLKTGRKDVVIPKNHTGNADCRANTGPVEKLTPVLQTLLSIKPGKTSSESCSI